MSFFRAVLLGAALALTGAAIASSQTPAVPPDSHPLPQGVSEQNGVMMMAPIDDADSTGGHEPVEGFEYKPSRMSELSAADHDLFTKALDATRPRRLDRGQGAGRTGPQRACAKADRVALSARQEQRREFRRDRRLPQSQYRLAAAATRSLRAPKKPCPTRWSRARFCSGSAIAPRKPASARCGWAKR